MKVNICETIDINIYVFMVQGSLVTILCGANVWRFFITHCNPYHLASKDTVARWVKDMLNFSGIDTLHYAAHSCHCVWSPHGTNSEVWAVENLP